MENGQKMFHDFIMARAQEGKQEEMEAALQETFQPPKDGGFDPALFKQRIDRLLSLLKPEALPEVQKMMNPMGPMEDDGEPPEIRNALAQPDADKWKDADADVSKEDMREAFAYAKKAHDMKCDCWNTHCVFYGECRKCIVFHLCLKQFPTCQRSLLGDLEDHYILFSRDK